MTHRARVRGIRLTALRALAGHLPDPKTKPGDQGPGDTHDNQHVDPPRIGSPFMLPANDRTAPTSRDPPIGSQPWKE
jgi:hypothetical protein